MSTNLSAKPWGRPGRGRRREPRSELGTSSLFPAPPHLGRTLPEIRKIYFANWRIFSSSTNLRFFLKMFSKMTRAIFPPGSNFYKAIRFVLLFVDYKWIKHSLRVSEASTKSWIWPSLPGMNWVLLLACTFANKFLKCINNWLHKILQHLIAQNIQNKIPSRGDPSVSPVEEIESKYGNFSFNFCSRN